MMKDQILITGAAGLVGQNLIALLKEHGHTNVIAIDKHTNNLNVLRRLNPDIKVINADIAESGNWGEEFKYCGTLVILHAQIGGKTEEVFERNNVLATKNILSLAKEHNVTRIIHISSSVINSTADDFYTRTKAEQESMVSSVDASNVILRPTLMFGWFDRKHLGWLSRFMGRSPIFPVPGSGKYLRQPLFVGDFCNIIYRCLTDKSIEGTYDISGMETVDYIEMIQAIKAATGSRTPIVRIPYVVFSFLLRLWAVFDKNPPFTVSQLEALVIPETFPTDDWPKQFQVMPTSFSKAVEITFKHPIYSKVSLEF